MSKTTIAYVKLVRDEHGTIIHSENADHLFIERKRRNATWTQAFWTDYERNIAAAEREACAQIAESAPRVWDVNAPDPQTRIAAAIRARK